MTYLSAPGMPIVTMESLEDKIKNVVTEEYNKVAEIKKGYSVTTKDIEGKSRKQYINEARQTSMFMIKRHTKLSQEKIGLLFGNKDHSTVCWSVKTIYDLSSTEQMLISPESFNEIIKATKIYKELLKKDN
jgi:chromosomal replication initiator protein